MVDPPAQAGRKANTHSHPGACYTHRPQTDTPAGTYALKVKARVLTSDLRTILYKAHTTVGCWQKQL